MRALWAEIWRKSCAKLQRDGEEEMVRQEKKSGRTRLLKVNFV